MPRIFLGALISSAGSARVLSWTNNTQGVVFGKGPAVAIGGVAARPDEARASWLWTYADVTATAEAAAFHAGGGRYRCAVQATSAAGGCYAGPPVIAPAGAEFTIWGFPWRSRLPNPNPRRAFAHLLPGHEGNFVLYDNVAFQCGSRHHRDGGRRSVVTRAATTTVRQAPKLYGVIPLELAVRIDAPGHGDLRASRRHHSGSINSSRSARPSPWRMR